MKILRNLLMLLVLASVSSMYAQLLRLQINCSKGRFFVNLNYEKGRFTTNDLYQAVSHVLGISTDSFTLIYQRRRLNKEGGGLLSLYPDKVVYLVLRGSDYQQINLVELEQALLRAGWDYADMLTQSLAAKKYGHKI